MHGQIKNTTNPPKSNHVSIVENECMSGVCPTSFADTCIQVFPTYKRQILSLKKKEQNKRSPDIQECSDMYTSVRHTSVHTVIVRV